MTPQLENGYTRIANEIMDALAKMRIPGEQRQCLDFIFRKTYGFNKKEDCISNSQFCAATGMDKGNVSRAIRGLVAKNIVVKNDNGKHPTYCFNKEYNTWKLLSKKTTVVKSDTAVVKSDNVLLSKVTDTKDKKDNITKDNNNMVPAKPKPCCPFQEILKIYHDTLPELRAMKVLTEARKGYIKARWNEHGQDLGWWREYFAGVKKSDFLCGRTEAYNGRKPFIADLEWLVKPSNMAKVLEGKYSNTNGSAQAQEKQEEKKCAGCGILREFGPCNGKTESSPACARYEVRA